MAAAKQGILDSLTKNLSKRGALDVIRHGFKYYGKKIDCAYFKAAHGLNSDVIERYKLNRLGMTRQLYFAYTSGDAGGHVGVAPRGLRATDRRVISRRVSLHSVRTRERFS